jgi:hypothetical protein
MKSAISFPICRAGLSIHFACGFHAFKVATSDGEVQTVRDSTLKSEFFLDLLEFFKGFAVRLL